MRTVNMIFIFALLSILTLECLAKADEFDEERKNISHTPKSTKIAVPEGKGNQVLIDGMFSLGEWNNALIHPIADRYWIYLMADAEALYVGLKFPEPIGECVSEIRITSDDKHAFLLHVSGGLVRVLRVFLPPQNSI